jgi:hypothetical protein
MPPIILGTTPSNPQLWKCTERHCGAQARTVDNAVPMHQCQQLGGALVPLVRVGTTGQHRPVERQDYVGHELVQPVRHRGRLIMSVETETPDSLSTTVYLPTAQARIDDVRGAMEGSADG